jgi:hypothetical protein
MLSPTLAALATGGYLFLPMDYAGLAEAQLAVGRPQEALASLDAAKDVAQRSGAHFHDAEIERLRGEALLVLDQDATSDALECFHRANSIAASQGATALQLRALLSECRAARRFGQDAGPHSEMASVLEQLPNSPSSRDVQAARELLDPPGVLA